MAPTVDLYVEIVLISHTHAKISNRGPFTVPTPSFNCVNSILSVSQTVQTPLIGVETV